MKKIAKQTLLVLIAMTGNLNAQTFEVTKNAIKNNGIAVVIIWIDSVQVEKMQYDEDGNLIWRCSYSDNSPSIENFLTYNSQGNIVFEKAIYHRNNIRDSISFSYENDDQQIGRIIVGDTFCTIEYFYDSNGFLRKKSYQCSQQQPLSMNFFISEKELYNHDVYFSRDENGMLLSDSTYYTGNGDYYLQDNSLYKYFRNNFLREKNTKSNSYKYNRRGLITVENKGEVVRSYQHGRYDLVKKIKEKDRYGVLNTLYVTYKKRNPDEN